MGEQPDLIAGRYRLMNRIGSGGMGHVWLAWDERLSRAVALKQLHSPVGLDEAEARVAHQRAMREARITARLHHPNAVPVFDVVDHDGAPCLVMQYLPSRSLQAVLADRGPLSVKEVARLGSELAAALAAAHRADIVHRDVKPGNVLVAEDGTARITDFGISHSLGDVSLTSTGMVTGTPAYLAPEVARGASSSPASDVFSLGATLYAAAEGAPPFGTGDNPMALLHRVASGSITPPSDGPLAPVLLAMLAADPADRPSMQQVSSDLDDLAAGRRPRAASGDEPARPDRTRPLPATVTSGPEPGTDTNSSPASTDTPPTARFPAATEDVRPEPPSARPVPVPVRAGADAGTSAERTGVQPSASPTTTDDEPPRRRRRLIVAAVVVAALVAAGLVVGNLLGDSPGTDGQAGAPVATTGSESPRPRPTTPRPSTTSAPAPSTSAPAEPTTPASPTTAPTPTTPPTSATPTTQPSTTAPAGTSGAELATAVRDYYALLPGNTDAGWARLTDRYRSTTSGSRATYERFWGTVDSVSVSRATGSAPGSVVATLRYAFSDGRRFEERTSYTLVDDGGVLKIDRSSVLSSRQL